MANSGSLTESRAAFIQRAEQVGLSAQEIQALTDGRNLDSLSKLAFAICPPGNNPTDAQVRALFPGPVNLGTVASVKKLIFESHTLVVADLRVRVERGDAGVATTLAPAEHESRITAQRARLTGLLHAGEEECSWASLDLVHAMCQTDALVYHHPEKFGTRRAELQHRKPDKELVLDGRSGVSVKEKALDLKCPVASELELTQALRRRALAFDLVGCCSYDVMNRYHSYLVQRMQDAPPPGFSKISTVQLLRADRAAFTKMAEDLRSIKPLADGTKPFEQALGTVVADPSVAFHLLPLRATEDSSTTGGLKRKHDDDAIKGPKGKGKFRSGLGKANSGRGQPRVPKELINKAWQTPRGKRLCWNYNLACGCQDAKAGQACSKGLHLCAEPGCLKPHSLQQHPGHSSAE